MRDKSKMRYRGVCVGGPRDGQEMAHDHRERIEHELLSLRILDFFIRGVVVGDIKRVAEQSYDQQMQDNVHIAFGEPLNRRYGPSPARSIWWYELPATSIPRELT